MNIVIIGAGQVGATLAEHLAEEENNLTIIDSEHERLAELQSRLDIRTIDGHGAHPDVLRQAGAQDADMLIAVSDSDETNMAACQIAYTLFQVPTKIARIRSQRFLAHPEIFGTEGFPIDHIISPEQLVTDYVKRLIHYPGTLQVLDFAFGKVQLVCVKPYFGGPLVGKTLGTLKHHMPDIPCKVVAIFRDNQSIKLDDNTVIEIGDEVFFISARKHIRDILSALRREEAHYKRVVIAGGGNIGMRLAMGLEGQYQVKLIEHDIKRCRYLSESLSNTTVLLGDASDRDLLIDENIEYTDVFCTMTNHDEINILAALQAKQLGVHQVMAIITRSNYIDLIEGGDINIAITPQQTTIGSILTHLRRGDIVNVHSLRRGAAEAIEVIAHGDRTTSRVVDRKISDIHLPPGTIIGAIARDEDIIFPEGNTVIEEDDHVILFLSDKKYLLSVERLFQVSATYV